PTASSWKPRGASLPRGWHARTYPPRSPRCTSNRGARSRASAADIAAASRRASSKAVRTRQPSIARTRPRPRLGHKVHPPISAAAKLSSTFSIRSDAPPRLMELAGAAGFILRRLEPEAPLTEETLQLIALLEKVP